MNTHTHTPRPQAGAPEAARGVLLSMLPTACAIAYSFRFTSFLHAKEAILCLGIIILAALTLIQRRLDLAYFRLYRPLCAFAALSLATAPLAHVPALACENALRWALVLSTLALTAGLLRHDLWRSRALDATAISAIAVAILGIIQYAGLAPKAFPVFEAYTQQVYSVFGNQDLFGGYIAMGLCLAAARALDQSRRRTLWLPATALLTIALLISGCRSAWLGAIAGLAIVTLPACKRPKRLLAPAAIMILAAALTITLAPNSTIGRVTRTLRPNDEGTWSRLWFWQGAIRMAADHPLLGVGPGNYAYWSPRYLGDVRASQPQGFSNEFHTAQPHSEPLRILAETGLAGLACWAWLLACLARRKGPAWGGLIALAIFALFNGPFDSIAHLLAGLILIGSLTPRNQSQRGGEVPPISPSSSKAAIILPLAAIILAIFWTWAILWPSYLLRRAEDIQVAGGPAVPCYERALRHPWPRAEAWKGYAIALADAGREPQAEHAFKQALEGLDTGDLYLALALLAANRADPQSALHWSTQCLYRWPRNPEAQALIQAAQDLIPNSDSPQ